MNGFGSDTSDMDLCLMLSHEVIDQKRDATEILYLLYGALHDCSLYFSSPLLTTLLSALSFSHLTSLLRPLSFPHIISPPLPSPLLTSSHLPSSHLPPSLTSPHLSSPLLTSPTFFALSPLPSSLLTAPHLII